MIIFTDHISTDSNDQKKYNFDHEEFVKDTKEVFGHIFTAMDDHSVVFVFGLVIITMMNFCLTCCICQMLTCKKNGRPCRKKRSRESNVRNESLEMTDLNRTRRSANVTTHNIVASSSSVQ